MRLFISCICPYARYAQLLIKDQLEDLAVDDDGRVCVGAAHRNNGGSVGKLSGGAFDQRTHQARPSVGWAC
jgi:hypothetical protein